MAGNGKLTRQQLYDKIRETSKDEYILSEMQRLGFWPTDSQRPTLAEKVIAERAELQTRVVKLAREKRLMEDPQQALKMLHKERKKAAMEQREVNKRARNKTRYERALRWYEIQKKRITFLGERFSFGLRNVDSDQSRLETQKLPLFHESKDIAQAMGISINELRFLAYNKDVSKISHYQRFQMQKKSGGTRIISAPMPRLKRAQYWILDNILSSVKISEYAHGFVEDRSIVSNASPHQRKRVVINMDLQDFFPTVDYRRVKGMFCALGYSEHVATVFALLTTEADTQEVVLDQQRWFVANGERFLPQGAPTSPYISNIICRKLDARLAGIAKKYGACFTRYADDLTFSLDDTDNKVLTRLLWAVRKVIADEGFVLHPDKTRIMRAHKKQEVTGVVVNDKLSVDRKTLKRFRALLFQIDKDGPAGKEWGKGELFNAIDGFANFVAMVNPEKGIPLQKKVANLKRKYGIKVKAGKITALNKKLFRFKSARGEAPRENWWMPLLPEMPVLEKTQQQFDEEKKAAKQANKPPKAQNQQRAQSRSQSPQAPTRASRPKGNRNFWRVFWFILITVWVVKLLNELLN